MQPGPSSPAPSASGLPVAVIGAGPVGLAALAHLLSRGLPAILLEAGESVARSYEEFRHVRLFSPWQYNIDSAAAHFLEASGWTPPAADLIPTAGEVIDDYLAPLAALPLMREHIRLAHRVTAVSRKGVDRVGTAGRAGRPFVLRTDTRGTEIELLASAVIDATGTWGQPNPVGASGLPALGEVAQQARIRYGMPDILGTERGRYAGRKVAVVGAGHSAIGNLLALARLAETEPGTRIVWLIRGYDLTRLLGGGEADGLPARGALGIRLRTLLDDGRIELHRGFRVHAIEEAAAGQLKITADDAALATVDGVDQIIAATGARPDLAPLRELRINIDSALESSAALAPLIDPNVHSCGTVRPHGHRELAHPEPGFYIVGAKSYGRAPTFLMATGYEQARSVVAALAGDIVAADEVHLELPETGVCSGGRTAEACCTPAGSPQPPLPPAAAIGSGCCAAPTAQPATTRRHPAAPDLAPAPCCAGA